MTAIAGPLEEAGGTREILHHNRALPVEEPQAHTTIQGATLTPLAVESGCQCRVAIDPFAILIQRPELCAPRSDFGFARLLEEGRGARLVPKHVLTLQEPEPELVAGRCVPRLALATQALGHLTSGMASR